MSMRMAVKLALITTMLSITECIYTSESVNGSPLNGQDGFAKLNTSIQQTVQLLANLVRETSGNASLEIQQLRELIVSQANTLQQLQTVQQVGKTSLFPAGSCREIKQRYPRSSSGYYWIQGSGSVGPVRMYCDMTRSCKGVSGGWMRVAYINMDNPSNYCPTGLITMTTHGRRRCSSPNHGCLLYTSPSPRDATLSRMPSSA